VAGDNSSHDNLILPGQSRPASKKLQKAVAEAQEGLERTIVFLPVQDHPKTVVRSMAQGYRDSDGERERIWLDACLPRLAQEATAAHELGHVVQRKERYPRISSFRGSAGRPLFPSLERIAARASDVVLDESADLWAIKRGFNMSYALRQIDLKGTVAGLKSEPIEKEASDWKTYYAGLNRLASILGKRKTPPPSFEIGPEASTQAMAMDYAGLSLRLKRYGLFDGLDATWGKHWPVSRKMGKQLAVTVSLNGVQNREKCRLAIEKIAAFLNIPEPLIKIG
jgi:hypothetical protein